MTAKLSIIVPAYNECSNVEALVSALEKVLDDSLAWEVIFVDDDSTDHTADLVKSIASRKVHVRCIRRIGRRGLSSACIEGVLSSSALYIAVMDADLQHDEALLPKMLDLLDEDKSLDLVIGSRYIDGGDNAGLNKARSKVSRLGALLGKLIIKSDVSDLMSGFFMIRRSVFEHYARRLSGKGFKILLDLLAVAGNAVKHREIPYQMRSRKAGESKFDAFVMWEYFLLLARRLSGRLIPIRYISFTTIGLTGVFVHLAVLKFSLFFAQEPFWAAQAVATLVAMTSNFFLNNFFTYKDVSLRGKSLVKGLALFYIACSLGAVVNIIIAKYFYSRGLVWWLSGLSGVAVGSVWNYSVTSVYIWNRSAERQ